MVAKLSDDEVIVVHGIRVRAATKICSWCGKSFKCAKIPRLSRKWCSHHCKVNLRHRLSEGEDITNLINPTTPGAAYILGLIWADGTIKDGAIRLEIVKEDLLDIKNLFLGCGNWAYYERSRPNRKPVASMNIKSWSLFDFLSSHGYLLKKGNVPCTIIDVIPEHLKKFWYLGYWDGDGNFYFNKKTKAFQVAASGPYEADWHFLQKMFERLNVSTNIARVIVPNGNRYSCLRATNKNAFKQLGTFFYSGQALLLGFKRKYHKFMEGLALITNR